MRRNFVLLARRNVELAKVRWIDELGKHHLQALRSLTESYGFAVALGDLLLLQGNWYVTHAGLLRLAARSRCHGIHVQQVRDFCDPAACRWVFKASVYKSPDSKGFVGYGDADPSNVSSLVLGAELRIAETRAVNRALAQGLRDRPLLGRRVGRVFESAETFHHAFTSEQRSFLQWFE